MHSCGIIRSETLSSSPSPTQQDGFIHLTKDPQFLIGIGNHFYKDIQGDFILLVLDPTKLTAKVGRGG